MVNVSCRQCGTAVNPKARFCENCGADLAVATVLPEPTSPTPHILPEGVVISPEILVPRIGEFLIERGSLKPDELRQALEYQENQKAGGRPLLIGQALLELNLVKRETLDQAVTMHILQLQAAINRANRQLEQRVLERTGDLQQALERLSELNQLKSNFIANISHELRTPLTHLKGYLDILSNGNLGPLNEAQAEALRVMVKAEERLGRLIEDLIQFALASRGELSLNIAPVQLMKILQKVVAEVQPRAEKANIQFATRFPDILPMMYLDEEKITWVLMQLLENSVKFTNPGGTIEVEACRDGELVTLAVIDNGIGIPDERLNEIFEPFHQLDGSPTRRVGGTGLGLAMAARIIEAHGSHIKVKSVVGGGSRFEFTLSTAISLSSMPTFE